MKADDFTLVAVVLQVMQQHWDKTELGFVLPLSLPQGMSGCHLTTGEVLQTAFRRVSQNSEVMAYNAVNYLFF